jgi:oligopeptide transport system substrate-binding protein
MSRAASIAVALVLLLSGCAAPWSSASGPRTTLNWFINTGAGSWVSTLDPALVTDANLAAELSLIHANLVRVSYPSMRVVPDLATWTVSGGGRVWTFHLRPRARFSNGDPVTAPDAAWSITRSLLPATHSTVALTYLGHIVGATRVALGKAKTVRGLKVLDAHTLKITLDSPIAYFLPALSWPTADVLDPRVLRGQQAGSYLTDTCTANVGAGPFMLVCRNSKSARQSFYSLTGVPTLDFRPNPHYFGKRPHINIHAPFLPDPDQAWKWYRSGSLDGAPVPPSIPTARLTHRRIVQAPQLQTDFLTPNTEIPPFNNVPCRLAVAYAINRVAITRGVLHGSEAPLYDVLPPGLAGYAGAGSAGAPSYDPARARSYLAHCPGKLRGTVLTYDNSTPALRAEYGRVVEDLRAIGAEISTRPLSFHPWLNIIGKGMNAGKTRIQLLQNLWIADYPDPQDWFDTLLHTGGNFDIGGFSDARFDSLVGKADLNGNRVQRTQQYQQAQSIALQQGAYIPIGYAVGRYAIDPHVRGMLVSAAGVWPRGGDWSTVRIAR